MNRRKEGTFGQHLLMAILFFLLTCSKVFGMSDEACLECHSDPEMTTEKDGTEISLFVDHTVFQATVHAENGCISCHDDADVEEGEEHPVPLASVVCANCHEDIGEEYENSMHGQARINAGDLQAPKCYDCHTKHSILPPSDKRSSTFPLNIPTTCGRCHREDSDMNKSHNIGEHNIVANYSMSIHGKGLYEDGLIVTAVCSSCHTPHNVQRPNDPRSSVNRNNIVETCNQCHVGIVDKFNKSVHSPNVTKTDKRLPICVDCHSSHGIARVSEKDFRQIIGRQCANCHRHESESYFETYHGRASMLWGGEKAAKCSDCHGAHNIMPSHSPESMLNNANIVKTCAQCHPKTNQSFTTYIAHGTHHDKEKYPVLFYTFWVMTGLLVGTFSVFGLHTILWIPRSIIERFKAISKS